MGGQSYYAIPGGSSASLLLHDNDTSDLSLTALKQNLDVHVSDWYASALNRINGEIDAMRDASNEFWDWYGALEENASKNIDSFFTLKDDLIEAFLNLASDEWQAFGAGTRAVSDFIGSQTATLNFTPSDVRGQAITGLDELREEVTRRVLVRLNRYRSLLETWSDDYTTAPQRIDRQTYLTNLLCLKQELDSTAPRTQPSASTKNQVLGEILVTFAKRQGYYNELSYSTADGWISSRYVYYPWDVDSKDVADKLNSIQHSPSTP